MLSLEQSYMKHVPSAGVKWSAAQFSKPEYTIFNSGLCQDIGLDEKYLNSEHGLKFFLGHKDVDIQPYALAYSGHQFGHFSPQLGDGRALLIGEFRDKSDRIFDLHLKGSGMTPFSRGGDGKAVLGPMLREYLISEAMHALNIPTSRSLAVISTGENIYRDGYLPGAILVRIASSHIRVGTFQYFASRGDNHSLKQLLEYTINRHFPQRANADIPALALLEAVVDKQARLIAKWMASGFVHGVMNSDNMAISGETIDYGPCAFMDQFAFDTVFSSIDKNGRYAYGNQPKIAAWNLARFAETLLDFIDSDEKRAVHKVSEILNGFLPQFEKYWQQEILKKLGLSSKVDDTLTQNLMIDLLKLFHNNLLDYTLFFKQLERWVVNENQDVFTNIKDQKSLNEWLTLYIEIINQQAENKSEIVKTMSLTNPVYIARNHKVEYALDCANNGDLKPFHVLLALLQAPYERIAGREDFEVAQENHKPYITYCGT